MRRHTWMAAVLMLGIVGDAHSQPPAATATPCDPTAVILEEIDAMDVGPLDWPQFGCSSHRNNTPHGENIPTFWDIDTGENILWSSPLGLPAIGALAVANGRLYVGMSNEHGYVERFPREIDLGCLNCFDEATGEFLWQHSNLKLPSGRSQDYPGQGVCSVPYCDGDRLWYVSNRGCVCCLDALGFTDGENDGPYQSEGNQNLDEADIVWEFDMMQELGISQYQMCCCACTAWGDILFINTGNGTDYSEVNVPAPNAPSFVAMNRHTAEVLWTDNSPGINILLGQWCSPTAAVLGRVPQVLFGGGDGWLYSFAVEGDGAGNPELLWKFDTNPKVSIRDSGSGSTRNIILGCPVVYDGLVYVAVGDTPEHGEGPGHLWCIDPTRRGDVSSELAVDADGNVMPHGRTQAVIAAYGERALPNPNSAIVWHYSESDVNHDGEIAFDEEMHRTMGEAAIKEDLLFIADIAGVFHCLDAKTVQLYWSHDMYAAAWGAPMIVDDKVYIGDEEGDIAIFELSSERNLLAEIFMQNSVYGTPVVANNTLYIANRRTLFAIAEE